MATLQGPVPTWPAGPVLVQPRHTIVHPASLAANAAVAMQRGRAPTRAGWVAQALEAQAARAHGHGQERSHDARAVRVVRAEHRPLSAPEASMAPRPVLRAPTSVAVVPGHRQPQQLVQVHVPSWATPRDVGLRSGAPAQAEGHPLLHGGGQAPSTPSRSPLRHTLSPVKQRVVLSPSRGTSSTSQQRLRSPLQATSPSRHGASPDPSMKGASPVRPVLLGSPGSMAALGRSASMRSGASPPHAGSMTVRHPPAPVSPAHVRTASWPMTAVAVAAPPPQVAAPVRLPDLSAIMATSMSATSMAGKPTWTTVRPQALWRGGPVARPFARAPRVVASYEPVAAQPVRRALLQTPGEEEKSVSPQRPVVHQHVLKTPQATPAGQTAATPPATSGGQSAATPSAGQSAATPSGGQTAATPSATPPARSMGVSPSAETVRLPPLGSVPSLPELSQQPPPRAAGEAPQEAPPEVPQQVLPHLVPQHAPTQVLTQLQPQEESGTHQQMLEECAQATTDLATQEQISLANSLNDSQALLAQVQTAVIRDVPPQKQPPDEKVDREAERRPESRMSEGDRQPEPEELCQEFGQQLEERLARIAERQAEPGAEPQQPQEKAGEAPEAKQQPWRRLLCDEERPAPPALRPEPRLVEPAAAPREGPRLAAAPPAHERRSPQRAAADAQRPAPGERPPCTPKTAGETGRICAGEGREVLEMEPSPIPFVSPASAGGTDSEEGCEAEGGRGLALDLGACAAAGGEANATVSPSSDSSATVPVATFAALGPRWGWPAEDSPRRSLVYSRTNSVGSPSMRTISSVATPLRTPLGPSPCRGGEGPPQWPQWPAERPSIGSPTPGRSQGSRGSVTPPGGLTPPAGRGSLTPPGCSCPRARSTGVSPSMVLATPPEPAAPGAALRAATAGRPSGAAARAAEWRDLYLHEVGRWPANADQLRAFVVHRGGDLPYVVARRALQR